MTTITQKYEEAKEKCHLLHCLYGTLGCVPYRDAHTVHQ